MRENVMPFPADPHVYHLNICGNIPFMLSPVGKACIWGGHRLKERFGKNMPLTPLGETWECSTHPDGLSVVSSGIYRDMSLDHVLALRPDFLGTRTQKLTDEGLPILIKFIDAEQDLSVQVHPSDEYARMNEHGQLGKTEMWYVVDAEPGAKLAYGFKRDLTKEELLYSIENGCIERHLHYVPAHKGDVFFIPSGTVHAIGGGILVAEIEERSNLTYRLYDYNRIGIDGRKRELHIKKALDVADLHKAEEPRQRIRKVEYRPGYFAERIGECKFFEVEHVFMNTEPINKDVDFCTDEQSFAVFLCIEGYAEFYDENMHIHADKGNCIFIPANSVDMKIRGNAEFLKVTC